MRDRTPVWNRKKQVLIGTQDKVNPTRTMARRASIICRKLGPAAALFFWIVERIHRDPTTGIESTKFYIDEAAQDLDVTEKTIDNWLKVLRKGGWISSQNRMYAGRRTYSTYFVNPINELIQDDGHRAVRRRVKVFPTAGKKLSPPSGPNKSEQSSASSVPSSSSLSSTSTKCAEAGRTASACFQQDGQGDELDGEMKQFIITNEKVILDLGFKSRSVSSLMMDLKAYFQTRDKWDAFLRLWPLLQAALRENELLPKANKNIGFGWLFCNNREQPDRTNYDVVLFSNRYGNYKCPDKIFAPGDLVMHRYANEQKVTGPYVVVKALPDFRQYLVVNEAEPIERRAEMTFSARAEELSPAAQEVVI